MNIIIIFTFSFRILHDRYCLLQIGKDNFLRQGYSEHAWWTRVGTDGLSAKERRRQEVHNARHQGRKLGPKRIVEIKTEHPRDDATLQFDEPPADQLVRPSLFSALQANVGHILRSRKLLMDELRFVTEPNQRELQSILQFMARLLPANPSHIENSETIMKWLHREKVGEKFPETPRLAASRIDDFIKAVRAKTKKATPDSRE